MENFEKKKKKAIIVHGVYKKIFQLNNETDSPLIKLGEIMFVSLRLTNLTMKIASIYKFIFSSLNHLTGINRFPEIIYIS